jgi:ABC-type multidrug transport system fused ATPase/permease subunit
MAFEDIKNQTEQIQEHAKGYLETNIEYYKLRGFKVLMQSTTMIVKFLLIAICLSMVVLFGSIAAAFAIAAYLDNIVLGFLSVGGFYLILSLLLFLVKDKIVEGPILEKFSTIFFND